MLGLVFATRTYAHNRNNYCL